MGARALSWHGTEEKLYAQGTDQAPVWEHMLNLSSIFVHIDL